MRSRNSGSPARDPNGAIVATIVGGLTLAGDCPAGHPQSMLHPESSAAGEIAWLWWLLFGICTAVFAMVILLLIAALSVSRSPDPRKAPLGNRFIVVGGAIVPTVVLVVVLLASVRTQIALAVPKTNVTIEVIGHQWWWEVRYPDWEIVIANEIYIPAGEPVRLELSSADVIHSLWVPNLNGKTDLLPDRVNVAWLSAYGPGKFRGQCAEYCGVQHAWMAITVVALPPEEFHAWLAACQRPAAEPETTMQRRGREVFDQAACNNCHSISGSPTASFRGPDLTHVGSRHTLGAGVLPNTRESMAAWISDPQVVKPGNLMPRTILEADDLQALVEYLESRK